MPALPLVVPIGVLNIFDQERQSLLGKQDRILISSVPVGCVIPLGQSLLDVAVAAMINGTYTCVVDLAGLSNKLTLLLKATFGAGSVTTSGGTTMLDQATIITAATGIGAMASTVRQTLVITPITGEKFATITLVVAGGAAPVWTEGETYGN